MFYTPVLTVASALFSRKICPITVSVKVSDRDKHKMWDDYRTAYDDSGFDNSSQEEHQEQRSTPLPPLKYSPTETDGWVDIETPLLFLNAGKAPFASRYVVLSSLVAPSNIVF